tara:strand:- start:126 stop:764 length:639 start_codon:yes stop_codon:yes gene_type:complete
MSGISEIEAIIDLTLEQKEQLEAYHKLLFKWQKAINLISPKTLQDSWSRHFLDSAQIYKFIPESAKTYADLGCGGGFPGLVIAILKPELQTTLVESDERKGQFMRTVIREAGISNAKVVTERIEHYVEGTETTPDLVSARALASLDKLCKFVLPWAQENPEMTCIFMKGENALSEIDEAKKLYVFDVETAPSLTDSRASILVIKNLFSCKTA